VIAETVLIFVKNRLALISTLGSTIGWSNLVTKDGSLANLMDDLQI
jgi:hypothetical protein